LCVTVKRFIRFNVPRIVKPFAKEQSKRTIDENLALASSYAALPGVLR